MKRTIVLLGTILLAASACSKDKEADPASADKTGESTVVTTEGSPSERATGPGAGSTRIKAGDTTVTVDGEGNVRTGGVKVDKDGVTTPNGTRVESDGVTTPSGGGVKTNKDGTTSVGNVKVNKDGTVTVPAVPRY